MFGKSLERIFDGCFNQLFCLKTYNAACSVTML